MSTDSSQEDVRVGQARQREEETREQINRASPASPPVKPDHDVEAEGFSAIHYVPLIFACLPALGSALHGKAEGWNDMLMLIIVCWYLYQIVRVPWELYYASRARRISEQLALEMKVAKDAGLPSPEWHKREEAIVELRRTELISLAFTLATPWIGSSLLHYVKPVLHDPSYINPFSVRLFMLASGIKPWLHFLSLLTRRTVHLQSRVKHAPSELDSFNQRLGKLEAELSEFKLAAASKSDVRVLRDAVDAPLTDLVKAVRRHERKGELMRISAQERFDDLDAKVDEAVQQVSATDQVLNELSEAYHVRSRKWDTIQDLLSRLPLVISGVNSPSPDHPWLSFQSAAAIVFLPITLPAIILKFASEKVIGSPPRPSQPVFNKALKPRKH